MLAAASKSDAPSTSFASVAGTLQAALGEDVLTPQTTADGIATFWVAPDKVHGALAHLKSGVDQPYRMLYDLTAIDERMRTHPQHHPASDFTVVYHLLSFDRNEYIRIKTPLTEDRAAIGTITDLWPAANWYERSLGYVRDPL